jgi:hypothetical protein
LPFSEASVIARWMASCVFTVNLSKRMGMYSSQLSVVSSQ